MLCPLIVKHSFKWSYFELGDCTKGVVQKVVVQIGRCVIGVARDIEQEQGFPSFVRPSFYSVTLRVPPMNSEMGWTGELWSKTKFLILEN